MSSKKQIVKNCLKFELFYGEYYCSTFKSMDKAIKVAVGSITENDNINDSYKVKMNGLTIAIISKVDNIIFIN